MKTKSIFIYTIILILFSLPTKASFHLWDVSEVFSNADGTIQYIELTCPANGQQFLLNHSLRASSDGNLVTFTFPSNSGSPTMNKTLLIATANFANLPGAITPDFILPNNFIDLNAQTIIINFGLNQDVMTFNITDLPTDGILSLNRNLTTDLNSPTNFNGDLGMVNLDVLFANGFE